MKSFLSKIEADFNFTCFAPEKRHVFECMLNNKFRASQFYAYKAVKLSGISIIEKVLKNNKKQLLIFGIRISAKQECSGYKIKKMCGIYKTKKNSRRKIRTLFGIK